MIKNLNLFKLPDLLVSDSHLKEAERLKMVYWDNFNIKLFKRFKQVRYKLDGKY